jgi:hypothetical protein
VTTESVPELEPEEPFGGPPVGIELESPEEDAVAPGLLEPEEPDLELEFELEGIDGAPELDEDEDAVGIDGVELLELDDDEDDEELLLLELEDEDAVGIEGEELELLL